MKKLFKNFTKFQVILLIINIVCYTVCAFISWTLDGWIAWASCVTFLVYLIYNAQSKYISFIWIIISYLIYIYFNIKEFYFGEFGLSLFAITINIIAMFNWKKHTNNDKLKINKLKPLEIVISFILSLLLAVICYFVLKLFNTELVILNSLSISFVLLEYYYTFRRTKMKFVAGILSVIVYIFLWSYAVSSIRDYAFMFVLNGLLNIVWYADGIIEWNNLSKNDVENNLVMK